LYQSLIHVCHHKAAIAFLDSSGESLKLGLKAKPYLIKPNQAEFETLVGRRLADEAAIVAAAREIIATGVKRVVVSRAERGVLMVSDNLALAASIDCQSDGNIISHVGCGDALVAGLVFAKLHDYDLHETLKLAVACGTANLFSVEPGNFSAEKLAELMPQVRIWAGLT
jgi:fructose-1-phosphate kinase PfkB-like protein